LIPIENLAILLHDLYLYENYTRAWFNTVIPLFSNNTKHKHNVQLERGCI